MVAIGIDVVVLIRVTNLDTKPVLELNKERLLID
jgi:hypothetical protein